MKFEARNACRFMISDLRVGLGNLLGRTIVADIMKNSSAQHFEAEPSSCSLLDSFSLSLSLSHTHTHTHTHILNTVHALINLIPRGLLLDILRGRREFG